MISMPTTALATIGGFIAVSLLPIPSTPFIVAAGAAFGPVNAFIYALVGETVGAVLGFVIARRLGAARVEKYLREKHVRLHTYHELLARRGLAATFILRILPLIPLFALNLGMGLTKTKFSDYVLGTIAGLAVVIAAYGFFGDTLAHISIPGAAASFGIILGVAAISSAGKKFLKQR